ncbi:Uncharacterized protein APZ42_018454 [Daphnia magna]|uniref:Uncharacterized protein n=1 Tax=Daphnia magna TaxID=35525 RepID=A0A164Z3D4_9CRUS|nr:Uncharacterized protein APZ42_018454 [Daphnia magna]
MEFSCRPFAMLAFAVHQPSGIVIPLIRNACVTLNNLRARQTQPKKVQ